MPSPDPPSTAFATTRWTFVAEAANDGHSAQAALGSLFETYWTPLYRFIRRQGHAPEDAEDLLQGFFANLLEGNGLRLADPERGRFRAFLLGALKHYMANEWRDAHRQKRGGFAAHLSVDRAGAETGLAIRADDREAPDRLFDREWALALLDRVLDDLAAEEPDFACWKPFLSLSGGSVSYADAAAAAGLAEGAARVAVHRLRKRYRQRIRQEIARTLADESMVDEEMRALFAALTEGGAT